MDLVYTNNVVMTIDTVKKVEDGWHISNERLLQVLRTPLVSRRAAHIQESANQYVFEVARDATKAERRGGRRIVKVSVKAVNIINVKGRTKAFAVASVVAAACARLTWPRGRPVDRHRGQGLRLSTRGTDHIQADSAGRRQMVRVSTPGLHKGGPLASLTESQKANAAAATTTAASPPSQGRWPQQNYRIMDFQA